MLALDESIWGFQDSQTLSPEEEFTRDETIDRLQASLFRVCPNATLHPYGSQATGLQTKNSDIDLGFVFPPHMEQVYHQQPLQQKREMVIRVLLMLAAELSRSDWLVKRVLEATIPIVKCTDIKSGLEVDIAHLEPNALINADHIRQYIQVDCRVRPLLLAVKHWAKQRGINESTKGTLNSFGYCLMVIQYLQIVVPPVLPVLDINASVQVPSRRSLEEFQEKLQFWQNQNKTSAIKKTLASGTATPPEIRKLPTMESKDGPRPSLPPPPPPPGATAGSELAKLAAEVARAATEKGAAAPDKAITGADKLKAAPPPAEKKAPDPPRPAEKSKTLSGTGKEWVRSGAPGLGLLARVTELNRELGEDKPRGPPPPPGSGQQTAPERAGTETGPRAPAPSLSEARPTQDLRPKPITLPFESKNGTSVAELLFGYFKFYSEFNIDEYCVDTNAGHLIEKRTVPINVRRSALCILDPTDPDNNVARCVRRWEWQSMETEFKLGFAVVKERHHLGQACWDELTELVETGEEQYRRLWQKTQALARVRAQMEQYVVAQRNENQSTYGGQYQLEMTKALWQVGLRARSMQSQSTGSHFTPSNYTPTSDTPKSVHSGQYTPTTFYSVTKSPSYSFTPTGTMTPPIGPALTPWEEKGMEEENADEEGPGSPSLQPLEPSRSTSSGGGGVPYNSSAYQSAVKPGGRFRYDLINKMPWSRMPGKK